MIEIRPEIAADLAAIDAVVEAAFPTPAEAALVRALRNAGKLSVSLVTVKDGQVVGHAALSPVSLDPAAEALAILGLAPVAVAPEYQRQGIGSQLVESALAAAQRVPVDAVVVLGEPAFYGRFGLTLARDFGLGNEYQADEHFMVIELRPGCLQNLRATVRYAGEFAVVE